MQSNSFPTDTCVLVCSGPSLNLVDPFELGLPVVVISTGIRKITNPHYWILADNLNEMHEREGMVAYQNENIVKIIPTGKVSGKHRNIIRNFYEYDYASSDNSIPDKDNHLFSGKLPFLRGPHKTVTFAVQWLYYVGVKNIIWVGNDLHAKSAQEKYAYESNATDLKKAYNYDLTIQQVHDTIKNWYEIAKRRNLDFNWYSWKCGTVFEQFASVFDYDSYVKPEESVYYTPSANSSEEIQNLEVAVHVKKKEGVITKNIEKRNKKPEKPHEARIKRIKNIPKEQFSLPVPAPEPQAAVSVVPTIQPKTKNPSSHITYPKYKKVVMGDPKSQAKRIRDALR